MPCSYCPLELESEEEIENKIHGECVSAAAKEFGPPSDRSSHSLTR